MFLDSLRGIAALAVVLQHIGENLFQDVRLFTYQYLQLGQFRVTVFFLCSGFVIPLSLERTKNLKAFWISRIFRLYPLYWLCLAVIISLFSIGAYIPSEKFISELPLSAIANLTMLQAFLGYDHASGVFWSLGYEMIFYFAVTALFIAKRIKQTELALFVLATLCVLNPLATRFILHKGSHLGASFHLFTMFFGTLVYRWFNNEISQKRFFYWCAIAITLILVVNSIGLLGTKEAADGGVRRFLPMTAAWITAYVLFGIFLAFRNSSKIGFAELAGRYSYSLYLIHPIVIGLGFQTGNTWLTALSWFCATATISFVTFNAIEQPSIGVGKRIAQQTMR